MSVIYAASVMLNVTNKPFMLSVSMLNFVKLNAVSPILTLL